MAENEAEAEDQVEETVTDKTGLDNLKVLENIEVKLTVEVGSTELKIRDLLRLNEGSVVELERLAGDPLDILSFTKKSTPSTGGKFIMSPSLKLTRLDNETYGSLKIADTGSGTFNTDFSSLSLQLVSSLIISLWTLERNKEAIGFKVCKG